MLQRNRAVLYVIVVLCIGAILYWAKGFRYLVNGPGGEGAIDLHMRWVDQQYVFHRQNPFDVYFAQHSDPGPPAPNGRDASVIAGIGAPPSIGYPAWSYFSGYLFFWPPWRATRIYYAGIQAVCLLWLLRWAFVQGRQVDAWCGAFCAAAVAATASFCTTLANGQYGILVLALLAASMQLDEAGWPYAVGLLAGVACLKPNITGPFLLVFVGRRRWRAIAAAIAYLIIASLWIWMAIRTNPLETLGQMMRGGERFAETGYGPVSIAIGLGMKPRMATPLIALTGAALALAICAKYRHRPALDLFAVAGVAARLWTYHQTYDNLSVVFLLVALSRIAWTRGTLSTAITLSLVGASLWMPAKFTDLLWFQVIQCLVWIGGTAVMLMLPATNRDGGRDSIASSGTAPRLSWR
jgi:glycosyl transferase family 87